MSFILLEGSIASGKSLFSEEIEKHFEKHPLQLKVVKEPLDTWRNYHEENLLKDFCDSQDESCFKFELLAMLTMAECHDLTGPGKDTILMERSLHSAFRVFIETQRTLGYLNIVEYLLLKDTFFRLEKALPKEKPNLIVYLHTCPGTLRDRVMMRGRKEEEFISLEYLQELDTNYEEYIKNWEEKGVPVIRISTDVDIEEVLKRYHGCFKQIEEFCKAPCG